MISIQSSEAVRRNSRPLSPHINMVACAIVTVAIIALGGVVSAEPPQNTPIGEKSVRIVRRTPDTLLTPRQKKHIDSVATILADGRLEVKGVIYLSPSEAGKSITGKATNGWSFFLVGPELKHSLGEVRRAYRESRDIEGEDEDDDADDDDV